MIAQRLFSPADFYTLNDIMKMTGRSRSWTFNFFRRNGITHTCHSGIRHFDKILFDKVWAQTSVTLPEKGWITIEQVCNEFHMNRSFARLQLAVHQITRRTSGNTTYYSRQDPWLEDTLRRLPTEKDITALLPENWQPVTAK